MAKKRVEYTPEKDYVYTESEKATNPEYSPLNYNSPAVRVAAQMAAAKNTVKAPETPATYRTPEERAAMNQASIKAANEWAAAHPDLAEWNSIWKNPGALDEALNRDYYAEKTTETASPTVAEAAATPKELMSEDYLRALADRQEKGFSYKMNADYLYQQYKDQYMRQGKLAMQDTMGRAAALTGGFGNTYAERTGQVTYNQYLDALNDRVPELYQLALNKYQMEGDELKDMYNILSSREAAALENDWREREWAHQIEREGVEDEHWNQEFDYRTYRDKVADDQWAQEFGLKADAQAWAKYMDEKNFTLAEMEYYLKEQVQLGNLDLAKAEQILAEAKFKHEQEMDMLNYNEGVRQYNDKSAQGWAEIGIAQQNADTSRYNAYKSGNTGAATTPLISIKTAEDRDKAVAETVQFMSNPVHTADDIDRFLDQYGDMGDMILSLAEQKIADKDRVKYKNNSRLK